MKKIAGNAGQDPSDEMVALVQTLRTTELRLQELMGSEVDSSGRRIFANPALAEIAGLPVEEIIGKDDFDLVTNRAEAEAYRADDLAVIQSGKKKVIAEEPRTDLSGRTRFLQTIKIPFRVAETGEPAVLGICMDITERKQAEEELALFGTLVDAADPDRDQAGLNAAATGVARGVPKARRRKIFSRAPKLQLCDKLVARPSSVCHKPIALSRRVRRRGMEVPWSTERISTQGDE